MGRMDGHDGRTHEGAVHGPSVRNRPSSGIDARRKERRWRSRRHGSLGRASPALAGRMAGLGGAGTHPTHVHQQEEEEAHQAIPTPHASVLLVVLAARKPAFHVLAANREDTRRMCAFLARTGARGRRLVRSRSRGLAARRHPEDRARAGTRAHARTYAMARTLRWGNGRGSRGGKARRSGSAIVRRSASPGVGVGRPEGSHEEPDQGERTCVERCEWWTCRGIGRICGLLAQQSMPRLHLGEVGSAAGLPGAVHEPFHQERRGGGTTRSIVIHGSRWKEEVWKRRRWKCSQPQKERTRTQTQERWKEKRNHVRQRRAWEVQQECPRQKPLITAGTALFVRRRNQSRRSTSKQERVTRPPWKQTLLERGLTPPKQANNNAADPEEKILQVSHITRGPTRDGQGGLERPSVQRPLLGINPAEARVEAQVGEGKGSREMKVGKGWVWTCTLQPDHFGRKGKQQSRSGTNGGI